MGHGVQATLPASRGCSASIFLDEDLLAFGSIRHCLISAIWPPDEKPTPEGMRSRTSLSGYDNKA